MRQCCGFEGTQAQAASRAVSRLRQALGLAEDKHTVKLQGCHGRDLIGLFLDAQFEEHELVT